MAIRCLERAEAELPQFSKRDRNNNLMDLDSLNYGETVMNWEKLLTAPAFDFAHDMYGIRKHMDRTIWPGVLTDCFLPRCAAIAKATTPTAPTL
jgi:hypothetical protein